MELSVIERTPFIEKVLDELAHVPLTESGALVMPRFTPGAPVLDSHVSLCADESVLVAPIRELFLRHEGRGLLVVSARPHCAPGGVVRSLLADRSLLAREIALFGTHQQTVVERSFLATHRIQEYSMLEISREDLRESTDAVMMFARGWKSFQLLLFLDALDPAFAPELDSCVVGGLSGRELLYVVQRLALIPSMMGATIVTGAGDGSRSGAQLVARLAAELSASSRR